MLQQDDWFHIREIDRDVLLIEEVGHVQSYLIRGKVRAALIDTGMGFCDIKHALEPLVETPIVVFNTHWHFDHIGGNSSFDNIGIAEAERGLLTHYIPNAALMSLYIRPCLEEGILLPKQFIPEKYQIRSPAATFTFGDGDTFDLGGRVLKAVATPGHTHGSFSFLDSGTGRLFCGDLLYRASLYAHFLDSDIDEYIHSLQKLASHKDRIDCMHPGHSDRHLPTSFLDDVLEAFQGVRKGTPPCKTTEERGEPVNRYEFENFAILTKGAGSQGVDPYLYSRSACIAALSAPK